MFLLTGIHHFLKTQRLRLHGQRRGCHTSCAGAGSRLTRGGWLHCLAEGEQQASPPPASKKSRRAASGALRGMSVRRTPLHHPCTVVQAMLGRLHFCVSLRFRIPWIAPFHVEDSRQFTCIASAEGTRMQTGLSLLHEALADLGRSRGLGNTSTAGRSSRFCNLARNHCKGRSRWPGARRRARTLREPDHKIFQHGERLVLGSVGHAYSRA